MRKYFPTEGMIGLSDYATIISCNVYLMNDKKRTLQDQYDYMKTWIKVMSKNLKWPLEIIVYANL